MARYIYKPLNFYLDSNNKSAIKEFLELYKKSLVSGEVLVDLTNYDIYIANNGIEYPIPVIKELREKVIEWIESDENPIYNLEILNNGKSDKKDYNTLDAKLEKIKILMNNIDSLEKDLKGDIDEGLNTLMRTEREVRYFYTNLSSYLLSYSKEVTSLENDLDKVLSILFGKLKLYSEKLELLQHKISLFEIEDVNTENLVDVMDRLISMKKIVNMAVECNSKLDKSLITGSYAVPEFKIQVDVRQKNVTIPDTYLPDFNMSYMQGVFSNDTDFSCVGNATNRIYSVTIESKNINDTYSKG